MGFMACHSGFVVVVSLKQKCVFQGLNCLFNGFYWFGEDSEPARPSRSFGSSSRAAPYATRALEDADFGHDF